jgi:predicted RNase H-like nuclease
MVLYDEGLGVPNPMHILEEWTRHRLLTGQLNLDELYGHDALDALVSAYTAFMLDREPHHTIAVGDAAEGQIVLPTSVLRDSYS